MGLTCSPIDVEKERVLSLLPQELSVIAIQVEAYCDIVKGWFSYSVKFILHPAYALLRLEKIQLVIFNGGIASL